MVSGRSLTPGKCSSDSKGVSSSENLYPPASHRAPVTVSPPLRAAFCASWHRRHVGKGVSRARDAVYPIASPAEVRSAARAA